MATKVEQVLMDANAVVSQLVPLVGIVGVAARGIAALLRAQGHDAEAATFEAEIASYDAQRGHLREALDEFHAKYPAPPAVSHDGA